MNAAVGAEDRAPILRGREEQLAAIGDHIAAAAAGHGGVVFLTGSAGHGKTQLLAEASTIARRSGVRVGTGTNLPGDQMIQMGALLSALFGGADPLLDSGGSQTLQALPEQRYWLLERLESLLERAALEAPLMVTLDDVQWGDGGGCAAVRVLARRLAALPILWVLAFRPDEVPPGIQIGLDELERRGARRLVVGALHEPAVGQVVADLLQSTPDADTLDLAGRAHGSPFLLVELVRGLVEDGLVRTVDGTTQLLDARLPSRIRDGMRDRLQRLSTDARRAAQVASVVGGGFSFSWLAAMLDLAPAALLEPVEELLRAELLVDIDGALAFRHDLLREAVLETLPLSTRRALKRQAADVLMASGVPGLDVAGLLAEGAEPGDAAAVAALLQAVVELGPRDPGAAADLGRRALDVAAPDDPQRGPLVAQTALLLYAADRAEEGQRFADAALGTALPPEQQAEIRLSVARMYSVPADVRVANGHAALDLDGVSTQLRALHLAWLSHNLLGVGRVADARGVVDDAQGSVLASEEERAVFRLAIVRATLEVVDGHYAAALQRMDQLRASARAGEFDPALEVLRSETLAAVGRLDDSLAVIAEGLASAQEGRHAYALRVWEQYRGRRLLELGRLTDAAAALEGALGSDTAELGVHGADAPAVVALGRVAIHTGDDRLGRICRTLAETLLETAAPEVRRHAAWLLAQQAMARSEPEAARDVLQRLGADATVTVLPQIRFDPTDEPQLVRLALAIGEDDLADIAVRTAEARARDNPDLAPLVATAEHARGLRTGDVGALAEAARLFATAARPLAHASALEDLGREQVLHGSRDEGIASLGRALELHVEAGATWDAARLRGRLRTLGVRRRLARPARPSGGWAGLTDSELTVARLVAQGLTNRDAAARMFLSPHTVSMHLRHAFAKLEINSRVELAQVVREHDARDAPS